jgi:hypothetical protein
LATAVGLDRDRAFYPTVTIVITSYYALFAVMGASAHALVLESLVGSAFVAVAVAAAHDHSSAFPKVCKP